MKDDSNNSQQLISTIIITPNSNHHQVFNNYIDSKYNKQTKKKLDLIYLNDEKEKPNIKLIRKLISKVIYQPDPGRKKLFIINHADHSSLAAQNAMLKVVEEPPPNIQIILIVNDKSHLLETIHSRCQTEFIKLNIKTKKKEVNIPNLATIRSYGKIIDYVKKKKDRKEALKLCQTLIDFIMKDGYNLKRQNKIIALQTLHQTYNLIDRNINTKLALENCLFKIKTLL